MEQIQKNENLSIQQEQIETMADDFLGHQKEVIDSNEYQKIISTTIENISSIITELETETVGKKIVIYDKYKKSFYIGDEMVTAGQIIAARHLDKDIVLPKNLDSSGVGKKLRKTFLEKTINDQLCIQLNQVLAQKLAQEYQSKDLFKANAYAKIAERSSIESTNEQIGIVAELVMQGFAEKISIDRPDLGIYVTAANAYQDVAEKVDFIVTTKHKKRGASIEVIDPLIEERHIGIQFTVNTSEKTREHKQDQIEKAKARGTDLDDIVYFAFDMKTLQKAIHEWENAGKPLLGVWSKLSKNAQIEAIHGLFETLLDNDQKESLLNSI